MPKNQLQTLSRGSIVLCCNKTFVADVVRSNLIRPGIIKSLFHSATGAKGRAHTTLLRFPGRADNVIFRQLHHGGALSKILGKRFIGPDRSLEELSVTNQLHALGAPVPIPVLALAERSLGPWFHCAVATIYEENTWDMLDFLYGQPTTTSVIAAAEAAGLAIRRFHDAGGKHPDLHVKNLLLRKLSKHYECVVIDLDRANVGSPPNNRRRMLELMRLLRSLHKRNVFKTVGIRGCARFLSAYCGNDQEFQNSLLKYVSSEFRKIKIHGLHYHHSGRSSISRSSRHFR